MKLIKDLGIRDMGTYKVRWGLYECPSCEKEIEFRTPSVKSGNTTQCKSCKTIEQNTTHGDSGTRLFNIWNHMRYRCSNKSHSKYKYYGAKGVKVCGEWQNSYEAFKKWSLVNGYDETKEIDKDIICNKNKISPKIYSPNTCLWVTKQENLKQRTGSDKYRIKETV